jgi:hypothetical protein
MAENDLIGFGAKTLSNPSELGWMDWVTPDGTVLSSGENSTGADGAFPPGATTRTDAGRVVLWSYDLADGQALTLESIEVAAWAPSAEWEQRGPGKFNLGTVELRVAGATVAEVQAWGSDHHVSTLMAAAAGTSTSTVRASSVIDFGSALILASTTVIQARVTPTTGALGGHQPCVFRVWLWGTNATGGAVFYEGKLYPTGTDADQLILDVTLAAEFRLKSALIVADAGNTILVNDLEMKLDSEVIAVLGHPCMSAGVSRPARYSIPFGGLTFIGPRRFELSGRPFQDLGARVTATMVGRLESAGGGDGLGPVVSLVAPSVGPLAADYIDARYQPVSFRLYDADGIKDVTITVWLDGLPEPIVAFDDTGWRGRFVGLCTNSATPGGGTPPTQIDFVLLPVGGWRHNINAMKINALDVYGAKEGVDV